MNVIAIAIMFLLRSPSLLLSCLQLPSGFAAGKRNTGSNREV